MLIKSYGQKTLSRLQEFWMHGGFVMDDIISRLAAIDALENTKEVAR